ncbi:hypothetical protein JCM10296v2_003491 [Rhodotorula toruloides]
MSTQEPSKCCVCGESTTKRCQACAKSGIDLFFCSPEHQKLVWDSHKQVCGDKANPFTSPPLSAKEAALAKALADLKYKFDLSDPGTPAHFATEGSGVTLATHMEMLHQLPPGSFVKSLITYYQKAPPEFGACEDFLRNSPQRDPQLKDFVLAAFVRMLDPVIPYLTFESPDDFDYFVGASAKEVTVINSRSIVMEYSPLTRKIISLREGTIPQPEYE